MRRIFKLLGIMLASSTMLTACLGDEEETFITTYGDMMIQTFTLGTLNRYQATVSSQTGNDTIVKSVFAGSAYPMTIDHVNRTIYNQDSLPVGTDTKHVICSITTKNNGVVYLKLLDRDSLYYHNTSDSVDLSVDRIFRCYAINGTGHRDYTVHLNVSQLTGTKFEWTLVSGMDNGTGDTSFDGARLVPLAGTMMLFAQQQGVTNAYKAVIEEDRIRWQLQPAAGGTPLASDAWQNAVRKDSTIYVLSNGQLLSTVNASEWNTVSTTAPIARLVAASSSELYGQDAAGTMMCSADNGLTWTADSMEHAADKAMLPNDSITAISWPYTGSDSTDCVLMAGLRKGIDDGNMLLWRKICQNNSTASKGRWTYLPYDHNNPHRLPRKAQPSIVRFQGTLLAIGGDQKMYQSRDQGLSWRVNNTFKLPVTSIDMQYVMAADNDGYIWLTDDVGTIWVGLMR